MAWDQGSQHIVDPHYFLILWGSTNDLDHLSPTIEEIDEKYVFFNYEWEITDLCPGGQGQWNNWQFFGGHSGCSYQQPLKIHQKLWSATLNWNFGYSSDSTHWGASFVKWFFFCCNIRSINRSSLISSGKLASQPIPFYRTPIS